MTDEPPELVEKWIARLKPEYPIVALESGAFEGFLGVEFFPTAAVIAPDGTLAYAGSAGAYSGPLDEALDAADKAPLWPKSLSKVVDLMRKGSLEKSYGELLELFEGGKLAEEDREAATTFRDYLEGLASTALAEGRAHLEAGYVLAAVEAVECFAASKPPFPASADCARLLAELEALPDFKQELKGGELYAEGRRLEGESEFADAVEAYRGILRRYKVTRIAALARARAEELIRDRKVGYRKACGACREVRRACDKHHEEVSL